MSLSDADLALLRDEIGTVTPPTDADLRASYDEIGEDSWIPTALRILKRRRAAMSTSDVKSVSLAGVISVSLGSSLTALDSQIERLSNALTELRNPPQRDGGSSGYLHRIVSR